MSTAGARNEVGTTGPFPIEGYRFIERIAVGGMGEVYLAEDIGLRRHVAIKIMPAVLRSDAECKLRFRREAEALGRLNHPHICPVLAAGEEQGVPYYVMEYLGGLDLRTVVRTQRMDASRAAEIGEQIAGALGFAHRHGIVHRDFKPSNIVVMRTDRRRAVPSGGRSGSTWVKSALRMFGVGAAEAPASDGDEPLLDPRRPKLPSPIYHDHAYVIDFGLAHLEGAEGLTRTGDLIGTPHYMAPEMADGDRRRVGPPADVFAAGITLYEALTGRLPFAGDDPLAVMEKIRCDDPTPIRRLRPETPRDLDVIVAKCLEKDPKRRYPDGDALAQDLRRFRAGEAIEARPASLLYRAAKMAKRHREMVITAAVALAIAAATALWFGVVAPWRAAAARRAEAAPVVDRIARLEREARERLDRATTLDDCDAFLDWHEREGAPFARDFGLADIGHKSYAAIPMPEVWALRADLHERQGESRAALGAAARAWWSLQTDPRGPDAPHRDVTLRYLRALHDEGATRTAMEMARAWPADDLDDAVLDLWARAALAERQDDEAAAAAARLRGGPAAYRRALAASIPEGTVTAMRLCAFPPMGISGLRVEQGDASEGLWARHVPPIGREPIALSISTGHRTDLQWSTLLRSEGRLWSATIRSRAFSRAQVDRTRWARELAGGLLVQGRNVEAAAAFEALGDRLHAAVARFRAGLDADLAGAIRDAPFESPAYLALARPLLSDAERAWIRETVALFRALPPPPEWAPDWALLFGGDETAALVEQLDYAAMRLRLDEVERILATSDDPSVRIAGAAAYLQTWSDRVDVARAEALLGAEPAEGMRALIDLESGRYDGAAERYARLAARAQGAAKQTLWWQHDEARLRAGDEY